MQISKETKWHKLKLTPARLIIAGFLALILFGAVLLSMPFSHATGEGTNFLDSMFTSVSAVCVTGLVVVDTNTHWTLFGKIVILLLLQAGALGIMSVATLLSVLTGSRLGLIQRLAIQETLNRFSLHDIVAVFQRVMLITLSIETTGAVVLSCVMVPEYGWLAGIGKSVFLSVSAFCNAGFDLLGTSAAPFVSMTGNTSNWLMLLVLASLIIVGGLGFIVWNDLILVRRFCQYSLHTKIVLFTSAALILGGTAGYLLLEKDHGMATLGFSEQLLNSFFHSVSARTAGFNSIDMGLMSDAGKLLTLCLMFVGGAPGSTAGGIKVTTMLVLGLTISAYLRGKKDLHVFKRRIPEPVITRSVSIFCISLLVILASTGILLVNTDGNFLETLFESVSAFGTVGLSTGITANLSTAGKVTIMITMFVGRIGTITTITAFASKAVHNGGNYQYPDGKIAVG